MTRPPTVAVVHFPAGGHIRPLLPLVAALEQHGLRTVQWAPAEWEQACSSAGSEFRALPDLSDIAGPSPNLFAIAEWLGHLTERVAPWISQQVEEVGADVVLRDSFAQYGRYAALANGLDEVVASCMMAFHRGTRPSAGDELPAHKHFVRGILATARLRRISRRLDRRYGAPLGGPLAVWAGRYGATMLAFTVPSLQMTPDRLHGEDVRFVGPLRALSASEGDDEPALDGLETSDQLLYVSLGTIFELRPGPDFFRAAAAALAAPGRRVILSIGRIDPQEIGTLPAGVSAHAHVDQLSVLRRADLFLTHAGLNSVQEGLAAGVPLLLFPQIFEQVLNANVVVGQGAGLRLKSVTPDRIRAAADELLSDPAYAEAARRIAGELRSGLCIDEAVEAVARPAREHSSSLDISVNNP
jgi:MGT family glycosyltransferase